MKRSSLTLNTNPMTRHIRPLAFLFCLFACASILSAQDKTTDSAKKVTFEDDVKPIFRQHCFNCHNQNEKKGGLAVDNYSGLREGGGSGEIVYDDGDADGSRLWQLINHDDTPIMPPNQDKIPDDQLAVIRAWIEGGILENSGSKASVKKNNIMAYVAAASGKPEGPPPMPETVSFQSEVVTQRAAAATAIATSPWAPLVAIAGQKQIALYHTDTNELLGVLPFAEGIAQSLRFNRDGSYLIAGGGEHAVRGIAAVFDIRTGERVATVGDELDIVFDADANETMSQIALGGPQRMLRIYDVTDGGLLFDIKKHTDWIYTVAFSPDGVLIASGDRSGGLHLWEADTGQLFLDLIGHSGAVTQVAWRDDSNVLASASEDGTVKLWDINSGKILRSINAHAGGVMDVAFDHQGQILTAGKDKRAKLWDASGKEIKNFGPMPEAVLEAEITFDGKRVVFGDWGGTFVNSLTENPKERFDLHPNPPVAELRTKKLNQMLVTLQAAIVPSKQLVDQSSQVYAAAKNSSDEINAKLEATVKEIASTEQSLEAMRNKIGELDLELPKLSEGSRSLHDQVIANRVMLEKNAQLQEAVAEAEQKLADHLIALAQKRRERATTEKSVAATTKSLAEKREIEKKHRSESALAKKALEEAAKKSQDAKAAFTKTQNELTEVQQELNQMTTAAK